MTRRVPFAALVLLVAAIALAVRITDIGLGFPYLIKPDEADFVSRAYRIATGRALDHGNWAYGALGFEIVAAAIALMRLAVGGGDLAGNYPAYTLAGRVAMAVIGAFTVIATACLARRLAARSAGETAAALAGVWAGLIVAFSPTLVLESQVCAPNAPAALCVTLALLAALRAHDDRSARAGAAACLFAGLAASTKYTAGAVVIGPLVVAWTAAGAGAAPVGSSTRFRALAAGVALALAGFLAGSPLALVRAPEIARQMGVEREHYRTGHHLLSPAAGTSFAFYADTLREELGIAGLALAALGLGLALFSGARGAILWPYLVLYLAIVGSYRVHFPRMLLPVLPLLAALAALGLAGLARAFAAAPPAGAATAPTRLRALPALVLALAALVQTVRAYDGAAARAHAWADARLAAREWADAHLAPRAHLAIELTPPPFGQRPGRADFKLHLDSYCVSHPLSELAAMGVTHAVESGMRLALEAEEPDPVTARTIPPRYAELAARATLVFEQGDVRIWELRHP